ncbi:MAG: hypothetical protein HUU37_10975 [Bdellovibrionales bacterium]|nr:hypothetical protein [Bdellovibrionales bacterium]
MERRMTEMRAENWLPLTEYAARTGVSISTLRRKIKANAVDFRLEAGKYLLRCDDECLSEETTPEVVPESKRAYFSSDAVVPPSAQAATSGLGLEEVQSLIDLAQSKQDLRWRAAEARVAGLARKVDAFSEQVSELKMLVRLFEERLDGRR